MYFIGGGLGGRGALPVDNTPAQRKTPLNPPPPKPPPFLNLAMGVLSMISDFRESPPPGTDMLSISFRLKISGGFIWLCLS